MILKVLPVSESRHLPQYGAVRRSANETGQVLCGLTVAALSLTGFDLGAAVSSQPHLSSYIIGLALGGVSSTRPKTYAKLSSLLDRADNRHIDSGIWNPQNA